MLKGAGVIVASNRQENGSSVILRGRRGRRPAAPVGIELSSTACRIVELEREITHVRAFSIQPALDRTAFDALVALRGRRANVVVWSARSDHRQVVVNDGSYERMRAEARAALRDVAVQTRATLADIAPASPRIRGTARRTVLLATADARGVHDALAQVIDAGVKIAALLTPAAALLSLARMRRSLESAASGGTGSAGSPEGDEAYVVVEETAGCAVLVRGSMMLAARNLAWGYVDEEGRPRPREEIAEWLAADLAEFVLACRMEGGALGQIAICGGLPELRSMAAMLVERLDIEVEPLDSLFAIDQTALPGEGGEFRDRIAELRLAWAAAADARPPIDLFRAGRRRTVRTYVSRAAIAAGVAAGLGVGWVVQSQWVGDIAPPESRVADRREPGREARPPAAPAVERRSDAQPGPPQPVPSQPGPQQPAAPQLSAAPAQPAPQRENRPAVPPAAVTRSAATATPPAAQPPAVVPPPPVVRTPPPVAPVPPVPRAHAPPPQVPPPQRSSAPPAQQVPAPPRTEAPAPGNKPAPRPAEVALPFDAVLGTILYGADRRLAIIDGRIVEEGDEVRGARVIEIRQNAVMLRDAQGRLRRLTGTTTR